MTRQLRSQLALIDDVRRLQGLDAMLRTRNGVNVPLLAKEWGVDKRTVCRWLAVARELIGTTEVIEVYAPTGRHFIQRYERGVKPFFARRKAE